MATANAIQNVSPRGIDVLVSNALQLLQREKISCSFLPEGELDPMLLLGLEVELDHPCPYGPDVSWCTRYSGRVLAVYAGSPLLGESSCICLQQPGLDPEMITISEVTVLKVAA